MAKRGTGRRTAIIASRIFTPEPAAASFRLSALASAFVSSGTDVLVLTSRSPRSRAENESTAHLRIRRAPVLRDKTGAVRGYLQYLSFDIPLFFRLLISSGRLAIVEPPPTTGLTAIVSSWLRPKQIVYFAADIWSDAAASSAPKAVVSLLRRLESFVLKHSELVLAVSEEVADRVRALGGREVQIVGNGIDTSSFNLDGGKAKPGHQYFIYAGTVSEWQGADIFLDAFERVQKDFPELHLHFFAQGTSLERVKELASHIPEDRVHFHDLLPPIEIAEWLRGAVGSLVSVRPGLGYDFARPTKLLASLACGTPVIFAGTGPMAKLVRDNQLGLATGWHSDKIAGAMIKLLRAEETNADPGKLSAWVEANHSLNAVAQRAVRAVDTISEK